MHTCQFCFVLLNMGKTAMNMLLTSFPASGWICLSVIYSGLSQSKSQMHRKTGNGRNQRCGQWQCFFCVSFIAVSLSNLTQLNDLSVNRDKSYVHTDFQNICGSRSTLPEKGSVLPIGSGANNQDSGRVFSNKSQSQLCPLKTGSRCKCALCPVWKRLSVTALALSIAH